MKNVIGIVGGMGPYAGLDLLKKVYDNVEADSDQSYPDVVMVSASCHIPDRTAFVKNHLGENPSVGISHCVRQLSIAGATHVGISCNTAHASVIMDQVRDAVTRSEIPVRLLSIVDETYRYVSSRFPSGRLALFATEGTYLSRVYEDAFAVDRRFQIVLPTEDNKKKIWDAIYSPEYGIKAMSNPVHDRAIQNFKDVSEQMLAEHSVDAFIMGCTEIPLGMQRLRLPVPLIDPGTILARALVAAVAPERLRPES